jgi:hypothetical protein
MRKTDTREALVAELRDDCGYWGFVGNDRNLTQAADGASALENGAASVEVGHTVYVVDEPTDT